MLARYGRIDTASPDKLKITGNVVLKLEGAGASQSLSQLFTWA